MKIVVTGASGLLGAHLVAALSPLHEVTGVDRHAWWGDEPARIIHADLMEGDAFERAIGAASPEVIFHCAAMVNVDACEQSPELAFRANADLPQRVARAAAPDCLVVYITTDGIFSGQRPFASEDDPPAPRTVYGRSKLQGEQEVATHAARHLIVRTNFFGWSSGRKQTSAEWLYGALAAGEPVTLFDDFYFTPMYVVDCVRALLGLVRADARGVVHVAGGERVSKYDFGMTLARLAGFDTREVRRGALAAAQLAAPRPSDMSLATARAASLLGGPMPGVEAGLSAFLRDRGRPLGARAAAAREEVSR